MVNRKNYAVFYPINLDILLFIHILKFRKMMGGFHKAENITQEHREILTGNQNGIVSKLGLNGLAEFKIV